MRIIRLKSDNYDCWVSESAYREITLRMSSGDYGAHRHRALEVEPFDPHCLGRSFIDFNPNDYGDPMYCDGPYWTVYDSHGDCEITPDELF